MPELETSRLPLAATTMVIRVGRNAFVLGLHWLTTDQGPKVNALARRTARESGVDLFTVRPAEGRLAQYAVLQGERKAGPKPGMRSAAAALADFAPEGQRFENWLAAFEIEGGAIWVFELRGGMILVGGDRLFVGEEKGASAVERAQSHVAKRYRDLGGWQRLSVPASWLGREEFRNGAPDVLAELLAPAEVRGSLVRELNPIKGKLPIIIMCGAALALTLGAALWMQNSAEERRREEARERIRQQLQVEQLRREGSQDRYRTPDYWTLEPPSGAVLTTCLEALAAVEPNVPGFDFREARCDGRQATLAFTRGFGTTYEARQWLARSLPDGVRFRVNGEMGTVELMPTVASLDDRGEQGLLPAEDLRDYLRALATATSSDLTLGTMRSVNPPADVDLEEWQPPRWRRFDYALKTAHPQSWLPMFQRIAGIVLDEITFDARDGFYVLRGNVYVEQ